ncbi:DEAD/DEAH box helicase [Pandoraea sputorum]|uniref:DEAD/DEAH box helicase n=1 Tax=Pandoraea sputorum TaxID=93222 RepID=UPI00123F318E|nr:DEAD/DEAH box helicase [Pandoraea sputorum]VVE78873.1 ATP-dependent RNA helicase RhlE [Pandoraea sputorum]
MRDDRNTSEGVHQTVSGLHSELKRYIEAQYHIKDSALVAERSDLLDREAVIAQKAYIESTAVYAQGEPYENLAIPHAAKDALTKISKIEGVGVFPRPYVHQCRALTDFLGNKRTDLVVATGTGSGKTESFLMPIVGALAIENADRPASSEMPGFRALLLYPMNALVNDQVARIRRLIGNDDVNRTIRGSRKRPIRFGSYTGRTPYPGVRSDSKDATHIAPLFDEFFNKLEASPADKAKLESIGRWPSKDLTGFYGESAIGERTIARGKSKGQLAPAPNWNQRLKTQPGDRELMTRDEMQRECPDILVTNYSMLEYMLMRPIEQTIFEQTADWLKSDEKNELIVVLDEAHMYRGAGGAEVALLIRRLVARLGVSRSRVRFILTSASLGSGEKAIAEIKEFATDLTGASAGHDFVVVTGKLEARPDPASASADESRLLARFDQSALSSHAVKPEGALRAIADLGRAFGWDVMPSGTAELRDYLFKQLWTFGPAQLLISRASGGAASLSELTSEIFPNCAEGEAQPALDSLLALCAFARRMNDGRPLLPARLHLFFRGLPGLYACVDPQCTQRLANTAPTILGSFHTKPTLSCSCQNRGRVFEYLTHRDCGASFIRGWVDSKKNFVWHEPDRSLTSDAQKSLYEVEMYVEDKLQPGVKAVQYWLHISTGRLEGKRPTTIDGFRSVWLPDKDLVAAKAMTFDDCPACSKKTRSSKDDPSKIMDHVTKGEAPFATLVRGQIRYQPASKAKADRFPNEGKKVLIFSDGRQKAARLARDMPRDMELDLFRQTIALAVSNLTSLEREAKPTTSSLYLAFIAILAGRQLSMFDTESPTIDLHVDTFKSNCDDLDDAFEGQHDPGQPPFRYKVALLRLLCGSYYSLSGTTIGYVEPGRHALKKLVAALSEFSLPEEDIRALAVAWIDEMLSDFAFDADIPEYARTKAYGFPRPSWGGSGKFFSRFRAAVLANSALTEAAVQKIESCLSSTLAVDSGGLFLSPNALNLVVDLEKTWFQCKACTSLSPVLFKGFCLSCGSSDVREADPKQDQYLVARKGYWRQPVVDALAPTGKVANLYVEEHTAQLSNRDHRSVYSTTERHELRFQDILLDEKEKPIDVLSCTTTMEVGIDIGSLVAVALRNVPPQRENYQQRAGRAGRRGASVSSVVTYSQNGPHDSFYFLNPRSMVRGTPRSPELKVQNEKIARRHVHAYLIQTFFTELQHEGTGSAILQKSLGLTRDFFEGAASESPNLRSFERWVLERIITPPHPLRETIASWLPPNLGISAPSLEQWVSDVAARLLSRLSALKDAAIAETAEDADMSDDERDDSLAADAVDEHADLLEFLFFHGLLPTYAFPTELCSFQIEKRESNARGIREIRVLQRPQQSTGQALSEYAPGRLVVINKATYRSGGVFASTPLGEVNRARKLFKNSKELIACVDCSFVYDPNSKGDVPATCPVCRQALSRQKMITPEVFGPEDARELREEDREQDITYATMAQFPQPTNAEEFAFKSAGERLFYTHATDRRLLTVNKGLTKGGESKGFQVCSDCGCASVFDGIKPRAGKHKRPYLYNGKQVQTECNGEFESVFLGYDFRTDLVLLRFQISTPLVSDLSSRRVVRTLEGAAYSIAEALRLAASRHPQLDLDATEFGAGHRLLPKAGADGDVLMDVYLYDTLAGGAGYSELVEKYLDEILESTLQLLENCSCDTSCTECLDHFHNQHLKSLLDRKLASGLLRYAMYGTIPAPAPLDEQKRQLTPLRDMLRLDGYTCDDSAKVRKFSMPLVVDRGGRQLEVMTYPSLLTVSSLWSKEGMENVLLVEDAQLRIDVPGVHEAIKNRL